MAENEPPESEIVLDSRKAKVVALFAAAPSAALLFIWLYRAAPVRLTARYVTSASRCRRMG